MNSSACGCGHPDAHADDCEGASLFSSIDLPRVRCLNEADPGACRRVFKPLADRESRAGAPLASQSGDTDLLLVVPFTNTVRLKSLCISGDEDGSTPSSVKVFVNRDDMDFAMAEEATPTQEFELPEDPSASLWHPVRAAKFGSVTSLALLFRGTHGDADASNLWFVGMKGVATGLVRRPVEAVYEARAQLSDHEVRADAGGGKMGM